MAKPGAVPKSYSLHFRFKSAMPLHFANMYGFKSVEEMKPVLTYLENNSEVVSLYYQCSWKNGKQGRWMREETVVR